MNQYLLYGTSFWAVFEILDKLGIFGFIGKLFGLN